MTTGRRVVDRIDTLADWPATPDARYQPLDAELTAIAGLTSAADKLPYFTGSGAAALADFTSYGRGLVASTDAPAARTALALGTMATAATGDYIASLSTTPAAAIMQADAAAHIPLTVKGASVQTANLQEWRDSAGNILFDVSGSNIAIASDAFTRSDSTSALGTADTGQAWSAVVGTWGISSNQMYTSAATAQSVAVLPVAAADGVLTVTMVVSGDSGPVWRETDANNFYTFRNGAGDIVKSEAGVQTTMATGAGAGSNGDIIKVVLNGPVMVVYRNGTRVLSCVNVFNQSATRHGMRIHSSTAVRIDNWSFSAIQQLIANNPIISNDSVNVNGGLFAATLGIGGDLLVNGTVSTTQLYASNYVLIKTGQALYLRGGVAGVPSSPDTGWHIRHQDTLSPAGAVITTGTQIKVSASSGQGVQVTNGTQSLFEVQGSDGKTYFFGRVGIQQASPTAALDIPASTTASASMRVRTGVAPTSPAPNVGDVYQDGTHAYMYLAGAWKQLDN